VRRLPRYEDLQRPIPLWSPQAWYYGAQSLILRTVGRASCGVDLGYRHGFNSGVMLDYVYENRARGRWGIGALIDRSFLNAVGWRGIRQRKVHLKQVLRRIIEDRRARGQTTHIVDLAAGGGRYLLEVLSEAGPDGVTALLRDPRDSTRGTAAPSRSACAPSALGSATRSTPRSSRPFPRGPTPS
jgi:hypothetical protein